MSKPVATSEVSADVKDLELGVKEGKESTSVGVEDCLITEHKYTVEELCKLEHIATDATKGLSASGEW